MPVATGSGATVPVATGSGATGPGGPTAPPARPSRSGRPGARPTRAISAHTAAKRYLDLCVEVLNGYRPAGQLRPFTEPHRFADVADQLVRRTGRVRLGGAPTGRQPRLVRVRRVVISEPVDGVAEAVAILFHGEAVWAMALRLERDKGAWLCTFAGVV